MTEQQDPTPKTEPIQVQPKQLIGDRLEQVLNKVGADKAAQVYQRITRRPCNCGRRKEMLNNIHRRLLGQPVVPPK